MAKYFDEADKDIRGLLQDGFRQEGYNAQVKHNDMTMSKLVRLFCYQTNLRVMFSQSMKFRALKTPQTTR